jgi:hypothetical protein
VVGIKALMNLWLQLAHFFRAQATALSSSSTFFDARLEKPAADSINAALPRWTHRRPVVMLLVLPPPRTASPRTGGRPQNQTMTPPTSSVGHI